MCSFFVCLAPAEQSFDLVNTCISHWNPSTHINTAYLITTKQSNNKSVFQKTQKHISVHVLSNLMIINNTY